MEDAFEMIQIIHFFSHCVVGVNRGGGKFRRGDSQKIQT